MSPSSNPSFLWNFYIFLYNCKFSLFLFSQEIFSCELFVWLITDVFGIKFPYHTNTCTHIDLLEWWMRWHFFLHAFSLALIEFFSRIWFFSLNFEDKDYFREVGSRFDKNEVFKYSKFNKILNFFKNSKKIRKYFDLRQSFLNFTGCGAYKWLNIWRLC